MALARLAGRRALRRPSSSDQASGSVQRQEHANTLCCSAVGHLVLDADGITSFKDDPTSAFQRSIAEGELALVHDAA